MSHYSFERKNGDNREHKVTVKSILCNLIFVQSVGMFHTVICLAHYHKRKSILEKLRNIECTWQTKFPFIAYIRMVCKSLWVGIYRSGQHIYYPQESLNLGYSTLYIKQVNFNSTSLHLNWFVVCNSFDPFFAHTVMAHQQNWKVG